MPRNGARIAQATYQDQRASDIVKQVAANHGLTANVQQTAFKVTGTYYQILNALHLQGRSDWDLLVLLAQHEGFDLWVSGHTLIFFPHFGPDLRPVCVSLVRPRPRNRASNAVDLKLMRSQTLARDVIGQRRELESGAGKSLQGHGSEVASQQAEEPIQC